MTAAKSIPAFIGGNILTVTAQTFTSASVARATVTYAQKAGTIDRVCFNKGTSAGTSTVVGARIETLVDGYPSGTLAATGASGTLTLDATTGIKTITLGTPITVAAGDR